jgi:hypothetical protein
VIKRNLFVEELNSNEYQTVLADELLGLGEHLDADGFPRTLSISFNHDGKQYSIQLNKDANQNQANIHVFENGRIIHRNLNVRTFYWFFYAWRKIHANFAFDSMKMTFVVTAKMMAEEVQLSLRITNSSEL